MLINDKTEYYRKLRNVTENDDWESFILFMLDMIESSSNKGWIRLENIIALMESTAAKMKNELPKVYTKDLIEVIFKLPYTKRQFLIDAGIGNLKTAGIYLILLEEKGYMKSVRLGKEKLYLNHRLMDLMNENM